jgi:hypothetical protein
VITAARHLNLQPAAFPDLALLRSRFANFAARCTAFVALRCLAWMRLRRESDILGMIFSSDGTNLSVVGKSLHRTANMAQNEPRSGGAAAQRVYG